MAEHMAISTVLPQVLTTGRPNLSGACFHPQPVGGCVQELASPLGLRTVSTGALRGPEKQGCSITSTLGQLVQNKVAYPTHHWGPLPTQACVSQPICPYFLSPWEVNTIWVTTLRLAERGHTEGS